MGTVRGVYESNLREEAWFASSSLLLYHVSATIQKKKGAQMNNIIPFLGLEDSSVMIEDISTEGGIRTRKINHPIMQDTFQVVILLKQRRWRCTNELCRREKNETFNFIGKPHLTLIILSL